eukprot:322065-Rhodomonas_salina.2
MHRTKPGPAIWPAVEISPNVHCGNCPDGALSKRTSRLVPPLAGPLVGDTSTTRGSPRNWKRVLLETGIPSVLYKMTETFPAWLGGVVHSIVLDVKTAARVRSKTPNLQNRANAGCTLRRRAGSVTTKWANEENSRPLFATATVKFPVKSVSSKHSTADEVIHCPGLAGASPFLHTRLLDRTKLLPNTVTEALGDPTLLIEGESNVTMGAETNSNIKTEGDTSK